MITLDHSSVINNTACFVLGAVQLKLAQDDHKNNEQDLRKDKRSLKVSLLPRIGNNFMTLQYCTVYTIYYYFVLFKF